jgi:hypothetical protein
VGPDAAAEEDPYEKEYDPYEGHHVPYDPDRGSSLSQPYDESDEDAASPEMQSCMASMMEDISVERKKRRLK